MGSHYSFIITSNLILNAVRPHLSRLNDIAVSALDHLARNIHLLVLVVADHPNLSLVLVVAVAADLDHHSQSCPGRQADL